ncbi:helix-turn-helix domain-containing protein [Streptomyces sp. NPDC056638]|uniref:helix-turn-helix domain-containing protein n=1 Tax=Streptomyces sp. NPDC056638 TaxID=3345887 RepID=UPI0036A7AE84
MTGAAVVVQRRTKVRHLAQTGASNRAIAAQLGISKDTVRRDLAHLAQTPDQQEAPTAPPLREQIAIRNERAFAAMRHLADIVAQVETERVSHLLVPGAVAHQLEDEVRQHAATLLRIADAFTEYYPRTEAPQEG